MILSILFAVILSSIQINSQQDFPNGGWKTEVFGSTSPTRPTQESGYTSLGSTVLHMPYVGVYSGCDISSNDVHQDTKMFSLAPLNDPAYSWFLLRFSAVIPDLEKAEQVRRRRRIMLELNTERFPTQQSILNYCNFISLRQNDQALPVYTSQSSNGLHLCVSPHFLWELSINSSDTFTWDVVLESTSLRAVDSKDFVFKFRFWNEPRLPELGFFSPVDSSISSVPVVSATGLKGLTKYRRGIPYWSECLDQQNPICLTELICSWKQVICTLKNNAIDPKIDRICMGDESSFPLEDVSVNLDGAELRNILYLKFSRPSRSAKSITFRNYPISFPVFSSLVHFEISNIPVLSSLPHLTSASHLRTLLASNCKLNLLQSLPISLIRLDLSSNLLDYPQFELIWALPSLSWLDFSSNHLNIRLNKNLQSTGKTLSVLRLRECRLIGTTSLLSQGFFNERLDLEWTELDLSENLIYGDYSFVYSFFCSVPTLYSRMIHLNGNGIVGSIPFSSILTGSIPCGNVLSSLSIGNNPFICPDGLPDSDNDNCIQSDLTIVNSIIPAYQNLFSPLLIEFSDASTSYSFFQIAFIIDGSQVGPVEEFSLNGESSFSLEWNSMSFDPSELINFYDLLIQWNMLISPDEITETLLRIRLSRNSTIPSKKLLIFELQLDLTCPDGFDLKESYCSCTFGQFSETPKLLSSCEECSIGRYSKDIGQTACLPCESGSYLDVSGQSACNRCPEFSSNSIFQNRSSIETCVCDAGFYGSSGKCTRCPVGGYCPGNEEIPRPDNGYWRELEPPYALYKCQPPEACTRVDGNVDEFISNCAIGYTGRQCGACSSGFYKLEESCLPCEDSNAALIWVLIGLVIVLIFFTLLTGRPTFFKFHSLGISFAWIQMVALFSSVPSNWPVQIQVFFQVLGFSNLKLDLFSPECAVEVSFWAKYYAVTLVPLFLGLLFLSLYVCETVYWTCAIWLARVFSFNEDTIRRFGLKKKSGRVVNRNEESLYSRYLYSFFTVLIAMYTTVVSSATAPFNCVATAEGVYSINRNLSIACYEETWFSELPKVFFLSFLYLIAFPVTLLIVLWKNRHHSSKGWFLVLFGAFSLPYRFEFCFWEVVNILRRCFIVLVIDFTSNLSGLNNLRIFFVLVVFFTNLVAQVFFEPYRTKTNNDLTFIWIIAAIVCLLTGVVFNSDSMAREEILLFTVIVFMILVTAFFFSIYAAWSEYRNNILFVKQEKVMGKRSWEIREKQKMLLKEKFPRSADFLWMKMAYLGAEQQKEFFMDVAISLKEKDPSAAEAFSFYIPKPRGAIVLRSQLMNSSEKHLQNLGVSGSVQLGAQTHVPRSISLYSRSTSVQDCSGNLPQDEPTSK